MKKSQLLKNIFFTVAAVLFFVFSMVMWILSFENNMSSSSKVKFNEGYALYMVIGVCFIVAAVYSFVMEYKNAKKNALITYCALGAAALVFSMYRLSSFFSALLDYWDKEYFVYAENQWNLYIGLASLALFVGIVVKYFADEKK